LSAGTSGRKTEKTEPARCVLLTSMVPPRALTTPWATASPSPVPWPTGLVVKKGSKTLLRCSAAIPLPVSDTTRQTHESSLPAANEALPSTASAGLDGLANATVDVGPIWAASTGREGMGGAKSCRSSGPGRAVVELLGSGQLGKWTGPPAAGLGPRRRNSTARRPPSGMACHALVKRFKTSC